MYIYLDEQGTIKEIVNDEALRQTSSNVNTIHVYFDTDEKLSSLLCSYELPDGTITQEAEVSVTTANEEVPYDSERDLRYFEYFKKYPFYSFKIADEALAQDGTVKVTLRFVDANNEYIKVIGLLTFSVEAEVTQSDYGITLSQYNYLVKTWFEQGGASRYVHSIHFKSIMSGNANVLAEGWAHITNTVVNAYTVDELTSYCQVKTRLPIIGYFKNDDGIFNLAYIDGETGHIFASPLVSEDDEPIDTELTLSGSAVFEDNVSKE